MYGWFQELNSYFISNHLKHIATKNEIGKSLNNNDIVELVRVAGDFLIIKNGSTPSVDARKSIANILHQQFPGLDQATWYKKLTQRIKNRNRNKRHVVEINPSGDQENENQDRNRNKDEKGPVSSPLSGVTGDLENESLEYTNYENIDENDEIIFLDEGDSRESEGYDTYEVWSVMRNTHDEKCRMYITFWFKCVKCNVNKMKMEWMSINLSCF